MEIKTIKNENNIKMLSLIFFAIGILLELASDVMYPSSVKASDKLKFLSIKAMKKVK